MRQRSEAWEQAESATCSHVVGQTAPRPCPPNFPRLAPEDDWLRPADTPLFHIARPKDPSTASPFARARRVLVIASRFPPVASVGATRVRKLVKFLHEFGWQPFVLTCAEPDEDEKSLNFAAVDRESLNDIPAEIEVHRLAAFWESWPTHLSAAVGGWVNRLTRSNGAVAARWTARAAWRFQAIHDRLAFPDRGIWRIGAAVRAALRLHKKHRFDAIYSTGMPFSDHMIALVVRKIICRPWIAEFRDPWYEYIHWDQWKSARGRRLTARAEAAVVRNAARVVSVNDAMSDRFVERYASLPRRKFITIENGFDPADFNRDDSYELGEARKKCFRLVYAGSLYDTRSPDAVLRAFRRFLDATPDARSNTRFEFLGRVGPHLEAFNHPGLSGTIRLLGTVPHAEAARAMADADLNVVILPKLAGGGLDSTAKVYECLGCGKPILAAVPLDGAAAKILAGFDGVSLCDSDDIEGLAAAIEAWFKRWQSGDAGVLRSVNDLAPLTRRFQAGRLASCMNDVAGSRRTLRG